jgi:short-subunit dehydrogenase
MSSVLDVTDEKGLKAWIEEVDDAQPIDIALAIAGVSEQMIGAALDLERGTRTLIAVNVMGVVNTILPALARMRLRRPEGRGQLVVVSSCASFINLWPPSPSYAASKAFVRFWAMGLRAHLWNSGVRVNVICPGWVDTSMVRRSIKAIADEPTMRHHAVDADKVAKFMLTAADAANVFIRALAHDQAVITYPTHVYLLLSFVKNMPLYLYDRVISSALLPDWAPLPKEAVCGSTAMGLVAGTTKKEK